MKCACLLPKTAWFVVVLHLSGAVHAANEARLLAASMSLAPGAPAAEHDAFNALFEKGCAAQKAKDFSRALDLFQRAVSSADLQMRPMSWMAAQFNACHTLSLQGKKAQAAELAQRMVSECEAAFGNDDPLTSEAINHLGYVLQQQGRLDEAEPVYRHNVRILEEKYGDEHFLVAHAVCRHGSLLLSLGRTAEAETQLRRALAIAVKTTDTSGDRSDLCYFITHLAYGLRSGEKSDEARQLMDLAYSLLEKESRIAETPLAGSILRRQAEFFRDTHQLDRAEKLGRLCLMRIAKRSDVNRVKFYQLDKVAEVYRSILKAKGMNTAQIEKAMRKIQNDGTAAAPGAVTRPTALGSPAPRVTSAVTP